MVDVFYATADNTVISLPSLSNVQYLTFLLNTFFLALEDNALAIFYADFGFSQIITSFIVPVPFLNF